MVKGNVRAFSDILIMTIFGASIYAIIRWCYQNNIYFDEYFSSLATLDDFGFIIIVVFVICGIIIGVRK